MITEPLVVLALIGGMTFVIGFVLLRSSSMRHRIAKQDPLKQMHQEIEARASTPESLIHDMEIRLFDYGREVEGRIETTLSVLDRLIIDADQEIGRLETILNTIKKDSSEQLDDKASTPLSSNVQITLELTSEQVNRMPDLIAAGLSNGEISSCLKCHPQAVSKYRRQFDGDQQADAA